TRAGSIISSDDLRRSLSCAGVRTVCDSSRCPNIADCWGRGHATFLMLGDTCTRNCLFCAVPHGPPSIVDEGEPERLAEAVRSLGLKHVVITSVTRDDLEDGGASLFAAAVRNVRWMCPGTSLELLIPDMLGRRASLDTVMASAPEVLGHNLETVRSLQGIRDVKASYESSLDVLSYVKDVDGHVITKSSLMLGLGEEREEVLQAMKDLLSVNVDLLTMGQYLPPHGSALPLARYVLPSEFDELRSKALELGFKGVLAGPLVRSSYDALRLMNEVGAKRC
ncbi:MAG: lipoyl synthase, partial [Methanomassiliicoccales archaeon]|nr:lipoyl synthase [Methanomassiliicoccales archaeon]